MYSVTMKEKYKETGKTLQPCCEMFIPFGFSTHIFGFQLCNTVMCINCRRKARGFTLEDSVKNWNKKLEKEKQSGCKENDSRRL